MGGNIRADHCVDLVLHRFRRACLRNRRKFQRQRWFQPWEVVETELPQATQFRSLFRAATLLVFDDPPKPEQANGRRMRVNFQLISSAGFHGHLGGVLKTEFTYRFREAKNVGCKRATQVRRMASGMKTAKIGIETSLAGADTEFIGNHGWSINCHHCVAVRGLIPNPGKNILGRLDSGDVLQP